MLIRRWVGLSSLAGFLWFGAAQPSVAARDVPASIHFDLDHDYLIVARGSAGSLEGLHFLVDTGASPTVVDSRLADKLRLEQTPASIAVVNGVVAAAQAVLPDVVLGPLHRTNLPVFVEDLSFFHSATATRIDAVIGLDVLGQFPFEIDYIAHTIRFGVLDLLPISLGFQMRAGLPIVEAAFNGLPIHLLMDTGSSTLILFRRAPAQPIHPVRIGLQQTSSSDIGRFGNNEIRLRSLKLAEVEFGRKTAYVVSNRGENPQGFEGILSPVALGITRLSIDLQHEVVAFSR